MTTAIAIVSVLALVLWPIVFMWNLSLTSSDAAGNGLAGAYTITATVALWATLSLAVFLNALRTGVPAWWALLLLPLSGAAALAVTMLLSEREPVHWMLVIQALVPPMVLLFVWWSNLPRVPVIVGSTLFILSLLPWASVLTRPQRREADQAEIEQRFNQLTPDSPVRDWLPFLEVRHGLYDETVRKIKGLTHKQRDIEHMLNAGDYTAFGYIWQFDLSPTPVLCEGARRFLQAQSIALKPTLQRRRFYPEVRIAVDSFESTLNWLAKNGCPMHDELADLVAALRAYPDAGKEGALFFALVEQITK